MKKNNIIGLILILVAISSTYFFYSKSNKIEHIDFKQVLSTRLQEILGYDVSIENLVVDETSRNLTISNLGLAIKGQSEIFFKIGKLQGTLPENYIELDEIIIDKLIATNLSLPILDSHNGSSLVDSERNELYETFYDVKAISEITKLKSSEVLQKRFEELKSLLKRYKLTKSETKACSSKNKVNKKCNLVKTNKLKIQKKILALVNNYSFFDLNKIIKENENISKLAKFNEENILKALVKNNQKEIANSMTRFMQNIYDAQFVNLESSSEIPHLTIKDLVIREKLSESSLKELVGSIKDLSSIRTKMKDKTLFRMQGDLDKYDMKGISFRMVLHKGKNSAVSINSHILSMPFDGHHLSDDIDGELQLEKASGNIKVKTFIFAGAPKGTITTNLDKLSFNQIGYGESFSKLKSLALVTNYERKADSSYTDTILTFSNKFKMKEKNEFKNKVSNRLEKFLNSDKEMLDLYDAFLKNYAVNFNLLNESFVKLWPKYKATNVTLDIQP